MEVFMSTDDLKSAFLGSFHFPFAFLQTKIILPLLRNMCTSSTNLHFARIIFCCKFIVKFLHAKIYLYKINFTCKNSNSVYRDI